MLRSSFPGHRRYSITHRAVQRLRELVTKMDHLDDEELRDQLDVALCTAEDGGRAVRTLDAMLGEPQVLIPVDAFGETLFAIIKEETVVTVLPKGHGEEILQRGQALEKRVESGEVLTRSEREESERFDGFRRRWRRDPQAPVVIERRGPVTDAPQVVREDPRITRPADPVGAALFDALERGRRQAGVAALRRTLADSDADDALAPILDAMQQRGLADAMTVGDLVAAVALD